MSRCSKGQIEDAYNKIIELLKIVEELETTFEGRTFTLDGDLLGSIGEVMTSYYYGIELYPPSTEKHDGVSPDGREVQIKITQQDRIVLNEEPEYLIVLHLNRTNGIISEVYNGPGKEPWDIAHINKKRNTRYLAINKLVEIDKEILVNERIQSVVDINKYQQRERLQIKKKSEPIENKKKSEAGKTLYKGYINRNNQENCGCTGKAGNHEGQLYYAMKCRGCGFTYEANGCDVWLRKCPKCMI